MSGRKIGYTEGIFAYLHDFAKGVNNTVVRADISGSLTSDLLMKAFRILFDRHPFLHSILVQEGEDVWIRPKARFEEIPILFGKLEKAIEEESEAIIDTLYDTSKFLWKIWVYPNKDKTTFLFGFHHAVADGISLLSFFHQLIEVVEKLEKDPFVKLEPMPWLPNIECLMRSNQTIEEYNQEHAHLLDTQVDTIGYDRVVPIDERHDRILYYSLPKEALDKLLANAHEAGVTLNSLLFTMMCFASARQQKKALHMNTITPVNLRKKVNPEVSLDHFGIFITPIFTEHFVDPKDEDWIAFAKAYREELFKRIETLGKKPGNLDGVSTVELYKEMEAFNQQEIDHFPFAVAMTNLGRSPFPDRYIDHKIERFYFATNRLIGDIKYTLHIATVNKELHIAQVHTEPLTSYEDALEFKELFLELLGF